LKKLILKIILLFPLSVYSQEKNDLLISGGLGGFYSSTEVNFTSHTYDRSKNLVYELNPTSGFFFIKSLAGGIGVDIIKNTTINEGQKTDSTYLTYIMISPYLKYYSPFHVFIQLQYNCGGKISKYEGEPIASSTGYYKLSYKRSEILSGVGIGIGYSIKISKSICIEPSFKYLYNFVNANYEEIFWGNLYSGKGNQQIILFNVAITNFISLK
jgi:hypothetical protein